MSIIWVYLSTRTTLNSEHTLVENAVEYWGLGATLSQSGGSTLFRCGLICRVYHKMLLQDPDVQISRI